MLKKIFFVGTGQWENLGDVILRKYYSRVFRPAGEVHMFVEKAPKPFADAVSEETDNVYHLSAEMYGPIRAALREKNAIFIANCGEILTTGWNLKYHLKCMVFSYLVRLRGGRAIMAGIGLRSKPSRLQWLIMRIALSPYDLVAWRDPGSKEMLGRRDEVLMPDWAFKEGGFDGDDGQKRRDVLVVSLRGDRPRPSQKWLNAIKQFADSHRLRIVAITQVRRDLERSAWLASSLGGELFPWQENDFDQLEVDLRTLYQNAAVTISDRLHVLILAATEGSIPVCLPEFSEGKIERHFASIGYSNVSESVTDLDEGQIVERLGFQISRREELTRCILEGRAGVAAVANRIMQIITAQR